MVAHELAAFRDNIGKPPLLTCLYIFKNLDPICILVFSWQFHLLRLRGWTIDRIVNSVKFGNGMDSGDSIDKIRLVLSRQEERQELGNPLKTNDGSAEAAF